MRTGSVVLVYPYFYVRDPVQKLFPPLGILNLAAQLKQMNISTTVCDCTFLSFSEAVDRIVTARPAIIGMYVMVSLTTNAIDLLRVLRERLPMALFVAGGPLPTVYPERFVGIFDVVFRGESDCIFPRFCRDYLATGIVSIEDFLQDTSAFPGLYRQGLSGTQSVPPIHHSARFLDSLPLPDRSEIDHGSYHHHWQVTAGCKATSILITRGCPFTCDFCSKPVWGSVFRKSSLTRVFHEIDEIVRSGYDHLWIADDSFTLDLAYLGRFCEEKITRDVPFTWTCLSRVDRLNSDIVNLMREAGCIRVYLGLESGSDETLRLMGKRTTVADGMNAVQLFRDGDIGTAGFFMVGYPGESSASIEQTLTYALTLPLDEISINVPYPLPGSALFDRVADLESRDWDVAGEITFLYRSEFDESWLRNRIAETSQKFQENNKRQNGRESYLPPHF